jgi:peroxiredoxin
MQKLFSILLMASITCGSQMLAGESRTEANPDSLGVRLDEKVPNFTLKDYSGKEHSLYDYLKNKAVAVMFIATQCPVSNAYNERMVDLCQSYTPKGIAFLAINSNKQESIEEIAEHSKKHGFEFPVLKDWKNIVADRFGALVTPEIYLIDSTGVLRYHGRIDDARNVAKVTQHDLQDVLNAYLEGKPLPKRETRAFGCTVKRIDQ